jgi:23S rRNA maturation-related 3'-5' exoribonuclease YhaM
MVSKMTPVESLAYLEDSCLWIKTPALRAACEIILEDERFRFGWGSAAESNHHHSYPAGLPTHVAEVMQYCRKFTNSEDLIAAVIFHDCAKIFEYDEFGNKTSYHNLIRHVAGSFAIFSEMLRGEIPQEKFEAIGHCILSHHGFDPSWGSPVKPQSEIALILHSGDMWSANFGPGK